MNSEWKAVKLGDIAFVTKLAGFEYTKYFSNNFQDKGIPVIQGRNIKNKNLNYNGMKYITKDLSDFLVRSKISEGDILFSYVGTVGDVYLHNSDEQIHLGSNVAKICILNKSEIRNEYIYYTLQGIDSINKILTRTKGSVQSNINMSDLRSIEINLPPISEQTAIAATLACLDDKIELNNRMNKTLEEMAQAIFKSWFVDFDFPDENGNPYKSFGGKMVESELGLIPENWGINSLGSFFNESKSRVGQRIIQEYSITNYGIIPRNEKFIKNLSIKIDKNKVITYGQIAFGTSRQILSFGVMKDEIGCISGVYYAYDVDNQIYDSFILEEYMRNQPAMFLSLIRPGGRDNQGLDKSQLNFVKLPIPPMIYQKQYKDLITPLTRGIASLLNESTILINLRDTLLPKLMSGEIRVPVQED